MEFRHSGAARNKNVRLTDLFASSRKKNVLKNVFTMK